MMQVLRKNVSYYSLSIISSRLIAIITIIISSRSLGLERFAEFEKYINTALILVPVATLCLPDALYNFVKKLEIELTKKIVFKVAIIIISISLVISNIISELYKLNANYFFLLTVLPCLLYLFKQIYRIEENKILYFLTEISTYIPVLMILIISYLVNISLTIESVLLGYIVGYSCGVMLIFFCDINDSIKINSQLKFCRLLKFGIWLVPAGFLFNFFINSFRYTSIDPELMQLLTIVYRVSIYQVLVNSTIFLQSQDVIYRDFSDGRKVGSGLFVKVIAKTSLSSLILAGLSIPVWFLFTGNWPDYKVFLYTLMFNSTIMIYGWGAIASIIHNYYGKQMITTMLTALCLAVFYYLINQNYLGFMPSFILTSLLIFIARSLFSMYLLRSMRK